MVLDSLTHGGYLFGGKPLSQRRVACYYLARHDVMSLTTFAQAHVVIGGNGVYHVGIYVILRCKSHTALDNIGRMCKVVSFVERLVARYDVLGNVFLKRHSLSQFVGLEVVAYDEEEDQEAHRSDTQSGTEGVGIGGEFGNVSTDEYAQTYT